MNSSTASSSIQFVPLVLLLITAAVVDTRARRVPNWLSFSLILTGLALSLAPWGRLGGRLGWQQALAGCGVGFALGMVMYLFRAIGAGDVKLLAGVGTWIGVRPVLLVFVIAAVIGMVMALLFSARQGRVRAVFRNGVLLGVSLAQGPTAAMPAMTAIESPLTTSSSQSTSQSSSQARMRGLPFAVAIAISAIGVLVAHVVLGK